MFHFTSLIQQLTTLIGISFLRMLGIFLILPIISLSAMAMKESNGILVGLALGGYGITQALMQIPIGLLADKWGRKKTLFLALGLFTAGSLLAGITDNIIVLIIGRILQGCGAASTVIVAWISDITEEKKRPKFMAFFGASIGIAFALSLIISPVLIQWINLSGFFILSTFFGGISILLVLGLPSPQPTQAPSGEFSQLMQNKKFKQIVLSGFVLHYALSSLFLLFPLWLTTTIPSDEHWKVFSSGFFLSLVLAMPMLMQRPPNQHVFLLSFVLLILGTSGMFFENSITISIFTLFLFFAGFVVVEALLPVQVAKISTPSLRGMAIGTLLTSEFLGIFAGGLVSGFLQHTMSSKMSLMIVFGLLLILIITELKNKQYNKTL